jgi:hypothetical protein
LFFIEYYGSKVVEHSQHAARDRVSATVDRARNVRPSENSRPEDEDFRESVAEQQPKGLSNLAF